MLLTYFDEVKPQGEAQPYYWLGGLMVDSDAVIVIDAELAALAEACFGEGCGLRRETEFHATNIAAGAKHFKSLRDPRKRFAILRELYGIMSKPVNIFRVSVRLDVARIDEKLDIEALALMFLIEKIDAFCRAHETVALLIGDLDNEKAVNRAVQSLAEYREDGTKYQYGRRITNVVDTIHYAQSHHSRLLQLADAYLWMKQLLNRKDAPSELRRDLIEYLRTETDLTWDHKYKYWPPETR
jgi:hypothetical protein